MTLLAGRRCSEALNSLHALIYFAPEAEQEFTGVGLEAGGMCYFAGRAAAMGSVGAGAVSAAFYNFSPDLVARHIPNAWGLATPATVLDARVRAADRALHRLLGDQALDDPALAEAGRLAQEAVTACSAAGRTLYAAHADQPTPVPAHLALWHAATLLREYRGDGHIAALMEAELDGLEALITHTATGKGFSTKFAHASRGWTEPQWDAAQERLRDRGLLDSDGQLTARGTELRREIEDTTDRLGQAPYQHLGSDRVQRLTELAGNLRHLAQTNGAFPRGVFAQA